MAVEQALAQIEADAVLYHSFVHGPAGSVLTEGGSIVNMAMQAYRSDQRVLQLSIFNPRGAWVTGAVYAFRDIVTESSVNYMVLTGHTAGTFATDLAAGRLAIHQDPTAAILQAALARDLEGEGVDFVARAKKNVAAVDDLDSTPPGTHENVYVRCFETIGDGGFGEFEWIGSSTATPVRGVIHQVTGIEAGRWTRQLNGFVMPQMCGALGDNVNDDTEAFLTALNFAQSHLYVFYIPKGTYKVTMGELVTDVSRMTIRGEGMLTKLNFVPVDNQQHDTPQIGWLFDSGSSMVQTVLKDVSFYSDDILYRKIGFKLVDMSEQDVSGIRTAYPNFLGNDSIGVNICGRELAGLSNLKIRADRPIVVSPIPAPHGPYNSGFDHYNFHNCYLSANGGDIVTIEDGAKVTSLSFTGYQAWVLGRHGLYWVDTTTSAVPVAVSLDNIRLEQTEDSAGYLAYIESNTPLQGLTLRNCRNGDRNSLHLRNVLNVQLDNFWHTDATGVAMDVDATVKQININNCFWQTGSTASMVGQRLVSSVQKISAGMPLPSTAQYVASSEASYDRIGDTFLNGSEISLATDATYTIPGVYPICLMYLGTDADYGALFSLQGVRNLVSVIHEDTDIFSNTKDSANRVNVYAEGGAYIIQNKRAVTTVVKPVFIGSGQSF